MLDAEDTVRLEALMAEGLGLLHELNGLMHRAKSQSVRKILFDDYNAVAKDVMSAAQELGVPLRPELLAPIHDAANRPN
jgi:hypothetical protein